jgi:hypothetical protein
MDAVNGFNRRPSMPPKARLHHDDKMPSSVRREERDRTGAAFQAAHSDQILIQCSRRCVRLVIQGQNINLDWLTDHID